MHTIARAFRWLGAVLGLLIVVMLAAFGLLQTRTGQAWLAKTIAQTVSSPDFAVSVEGLRGFVPFRLQVDRIEIGDRDGIYLTLHDFGLDLSAAELLAGRAHIRSLSFAEIDMARSSTAPSTTPLTEYLNVPRLPIGVVLDRLSIGRLALAPPVLGESVVFAVEGNARLAGETGHVDLDLHRTDGSAGNVLLAMELAGATPVLGLRLDATEPAGILLDRLLGRAAAETEVAACVDALAAGLSRADLVRSFLHSREASLRAVDAVLGVIALAPETADAGSKLKRDLMLTRIARRLLLDEKLVRERLAEMRAQRRAALSERRRRRPLYRIEIIDSLDSPG